MIAVSTLHELSQRQNQLVWLETNWPIALFMVGGQVYAVDAHCTHQEAWLHEGDVNADTCEVSCPLHQARFNLQTGKATHGPAAAPLMVYPTQVDSAGTIYIEPITPWWR
ncbi:MAG: Rieske 2Fe-2S domain-containing protein [Anaerolineales bacterium]|nr:Rieske 2Fe-2S domain-containing protein [Anaerolineales bacterium]